MDSVIAEEKERMRLARLEQQIEDMLTNGRSVEQLIKEIDHDTFSDTRIDSVNVLLTLRTKQPFNDNKKLQKLINHYAIERDNMLILKP
jgi:hypothetical protein